MFYNMFQLDLDLSTVKRIKKIITKKTIYIINNMNLIYNEIRIE